MTSRHRSAGIAAALSAVLLCSTAVAVAASAESAPLTPTSRAEVFEALNRDAEQERDRLVRRYPSVQVPDMSPMRIVPDDEWPERMAECLSHFGVEPPPWRHFAAPDLNTSTLPREVISRTCQLRYPKKSDLRFLLGPLELRRLWGYYVFELQPCLRSLGVSITRSPSFGEYLAAHESDDAWHPYVALTKIAGARNVDYYDDRCPRFPDWLRS